MYQLAAVEKPDMTRLFVETCTSMAPSAENLGLVRSAATLVRGVLDGAGLEALRAFVQRTDAASGDVDDVLAAAGQAVIDELEPAARVDLADLVRRIAQIERDALAVVSRRTAGGPMRVALAG